MLQKINIKLIYISIDILSKLDSFNPIFSNQATKTIIYKLFIKSGIS